MFRILFFIIMIAALSYGLSTIADMDGKLIIQWPGGEIQPTLMQAVLVLASVMVIAMLLWSLFRLVMNSPEAFANYLRGKKKKKGIEALSSGLIALGSGDEIMAQRHAMQARKTLPNDPMTLLLRAQAAEMKGDTLQATRLYESMLASSDTEILGLRGLYMLALQQNEVEAAEQYAERAVQRRPDLAWAVLALIDLRAKRRAWRQTLEVLSVAKDHNHIPSKDAKRKRAVLLTALAMELEDSQMDEALSSAVEAVRLAPALIPASVVAGRIYASQGRMSAAIKVIRKCWKLAPHPDLAIVSAFARPGDSVRDRLERIKSLANTTPGHREAALAVATAAIEAKDWATARQSLEPLLRGRPSQKVCTLMARIEAADQADMGQVREWLSRAIHAVPDPAWVAEGHVADEWAPNSPISGKLDVFEWRVPPEDELVSDETLTLKKLLAGLVTAEGLHEQARLDARDVELKVLNEETSEPDDEAFVTEKVVSEQTDIEDAVVDGEVTEAETKSEAAKVAVVESREEKSVEPDSPTEQFQSAETIDTKTAVTKTDVENDVVADTKTEETVASVSVSETEKKEGESKTAIADKTTPSRKNNKKRRKRTKIFVSPPAPDDPGIEGADDIDALDGVRPIRY